MPFRISLFPRTRRSLIRAGIVWGAFLLLILGFGGCIMYMPGHSHKGPLAPLTAEAAELRDRLTAHVTKLAGEIGVRDIANHPASLTTTADYIHTQFAALGTSVTEQTFKANGHIARNIELEIKGATRPAEIIVIGAHYDSVCAGGEMTPGADDNASGVAGLIELARLLRARPLAATVRCVAFANEEPPYFYGEAMGSLQYARRCKERGEKVSSMLALETMGYYSDAPGSQHYPFPFNLAYPGTGNFIGFVGNMDSRKLVRQVVGSFRQNAAFPSEGVAAPGGIEGIGWSDHWAFWQMGYPALMVTDTAPFRNPNYHKMSDTPETLDYDRMARVVAGLSKVIEELAK